MRLCQCRLDHTVKDQCAFIRRNCLEEEAGLFSYLQLYYCKLEHAKPVAFILLTLWLGFLFSTIGIAASDFFCINLSTIANVLGLSESMAGVTLLAFGNGSPDVFSTFAAMNTHSGSLAIGELIGAAGFITTVVAGSMAIVRPFKVAQKSFVRDVSFFIVATGFSMIFLADGHLRLWESAVMVGFYIFYVITVVVWHWNIARKSYRLEREVAARGNFHVPGTDEVETDAYGESSADGAVGRARPPLSSLLTDNHDNLGRGGGPILSHDEDEDGQIRDQLMAEISGIMRVNRPRPGERRKTQNPIRPSFVGALEFRSVFLSLQNLRNKQSIPINLRRYSEDPWIAERQQEPASPASNSGSQHSDTRDHDATSDNLFEPSRDAESSSASRYDWVSSRGAASLGPNPVQELIPNIDLLDATPSESIGPRGSYFPRISTSFEPRHEDPKDLSGPLLPGDLVYPITRSAPTLNLETRSLPDLLVPLGDTLPGSSEHARGGVGKYGHGVELREEFPLLHTKSQLPITKQSPHSRSRGSSKASSFLNHRDDSHPIFARSPSLLLLQPSFGSESTCQQNIFNNHDDKPVRWWPYRILPPPQVFISTLFPTLYAWHDKNIWERILGIVAAPSVFFLAITLPVVESDHDDTHLDPDPGFLTPYGNRSRAQSVGVANLPLQTENRVNERNGPNTHSKLSVSDQDHHNQNLPTVTISDWQTGDPAKAATQQQTSENLQRHQDSIKLPSTTQHSLKPLSERPREWNRWLLGTQLFTAPFFIVLLSWANNDPALSSRNLILPALCAFIISLALFAILFFTTTVSRPPRYHYLFCFLGFIVSIAWISTIASEVVGVLKAVGIILGISDAILGLTIFAVGNSLGDLVANITVARLGFPVMALGACFGGPMLNILLGIGLSGLYMTIKAGNGRHERHPEKPMKYKSYQIDISQTLIISGITLLVTLAGLLIVVPLNHWRMDKRMGWGLVGLWTASTIGNVVMEVSGWGQNFG